MDKRFDFFTNRLHFVEITTDRMKNLELWHCLTVFEKHVYGVVSQYFRIKESLKGSPNKSLGILLTQAGLDIYYYTLTWDKLKQIYKKLECLMNDIHKITSTIPEGFTNDLRNWKHRIDHLFRGFKKKVRNEYEHPSLESCRVGNIIMWGNIHKDGSGNIRAHAGKDQFVEIRKEHVERLESLHVELIDIILKYFSKKPLTTELTQLRDQIEENMDDLVDEYKKFKQEGNTDSINDLIYKITICDLYLSKEGISISPNIKEKFYRILFDIRKSGVKSQPR